MQKNPSSLVKASQLRSCSALKKRAFHWLTRTRIHTPASSRAMTAASRMPPAKRSSERKYGIVRLQMRARVEPKRFKADFLRPGRGQDPRELTLITIRVIPASWPAVYPDPVQCGHGREAAALALPAHTRLMSYCGMPRARPN